MCCCSASNPMILSFSSVLLQLFTGTKLIVKNKVCKKLRCIVGIRQERGSQKINLLQQSWGPFVMKVESAIVNLPSVLWFLSLSIALV